MTRSGCALCLWANRDVCAQRLWQLPPTSSDLVAECSGSAASLLGESDPRSARLVWRPSLQASRDPANYAIAGARGRTEEIV